MLLGTSFWENGSLLQGRVFPLFTPSSFFLLPHLSHKYHGLSHKKWPLERRPVWLNCTWADFRQGPYSGCMGREEKDQAIQLELSYNFSPFFPVFFCSYFVEFQFRCCSSCGEDHSCYCVDYYKTVDTWFVFYHLREIILFIWTSAHLLKINQMAMF